MSLANTYSGTQKHISLTQVKRLKSQNNLERLLTLESSPSETLESPQIFNNKLLQAKALSPISGNLPQKTNKTLREKRKSKDCTSMDLPIEDFETIYLESEIINEYKPENKFKNQPQGEKTEKIRLEVPSILQIKKNRKETSCIDSYLLSDGKCEVLTNLSKSLHELNKRLVKNQEVTHQQVKENDSLKSKIRDLEARISEKINDKLEDSRINTGCNLKCSVY